MKTYNYTSWTKETISKLVELYPDHSNDEIAAILGVSKKSIVQKAYKLGIKKSKAQRRISADKGMFKPGHCTFNKGRKQVEYMSAESIEKTRLTRFKLKSVVSEQTDGNSFITIHSRSFHGKRRQYMFIRISPSKWRPLHLYNWEKVNGQIPKGYCLFFKDNNTLNPDISNLELITRKEARIRTSASTTLTPGFVASCIAWRNNELKNEVLRNHPDLVEIKRKQLRLQREIKKGREV